MSVKQFNKEEQERFWKGFPDGVDYKGDAISEILISQSKHYLGKSVLDIGGGTGSLLREIRKRHPDVEVQAIDLAPKSEDVQVGDCTSLQFKDNSFDTIFCTDVIEHLSDEDLQKCLGEVRRVLRPGGYGVFTTLNQEDLLAATVSCPECGCTFHRYGHCQSFSEEDLVTLFEEKGFAVERINSLNFNLLSSFPLLMKMLYSLGLHKIIKLKSFQAHFFLVVKNIKD